MSILSKLLDDDTLKRIVRIVERPINQIDKADKYKKLLKKSGFRQLDMGTNRQIFIHPSYPKVVFKVALDEQGVLDNLNEYEKSDKSEYFPDSVDIHSGEDKGYILVQKRVPVMDLDEFKKKKTQKEIRSMLRELESEFVLLDLGADKHKNYGRDKNGNIFIIDFGYVDYKSIANFNCPHKRYVDRGKVKYCKGTLEYNKDFTMLECNNCGNSFRIDVVFEGYTESRYADPPKEKGYYEPSDELNEFYKRFRKTRDMSTLYEYVDISYKNNTKSEREGEIMSSSKDILIKKARGESEAKNILTGRRTREVPERITRPSYRSTDKGIDIIHREDDNEDINEHCEEDSSVKYDISQDEYTNERVEILEETEDSEDIEEQLENYNYHGASEQLVDLGEYTKEEADKIVSDMFYDRFPEMKDIIETIRTEKDIENPEIKTSLMDMIRSTTSDHGSPQGHENACQDEGAMTLEELQEEGLIFIKPSNKQDEIHICMTAEEIKRKPQIVVSIDGVIFYIDILEHVSRLVETVEENSDDMIVTSMYAEPVSQFDYDYDDRYFEDDYDEDPDDESGEDD